MNIRDAAPGDEAAACAVLRRSIVYLCQADHRGDESILARWLANKTPENVAGWIARQDAAMLLAVTGQAVLAVGMVTAAGEIALNYVSPDARFSGVSRALLAALEARALRFGQTSVRLTSTATAHRFYLSGGYVDAGPAERSFGMVAFPMTRQLAPALPGAWLDKPGAGD